MLEVSTVFMFHHDELLLLQRRMDKLAPGTWCVPGGKLEAGESPIEGLVREIGEELKLFPSPASLKPIRSLYVRHPKMEYRLHLFRWDLLEKPLIRLNPNEHLSFRWHSSQRLKELPLLEGQYEAYEWAIRPS